MVFDDKLTRSLQACLNAPEPNPGNENGVDDASQVDSPEEPPNSHLQPQSSRPGMQQNPHMPASYMPNVPMDPQAMYQGYVQRGAPPPYGMPGQSGMPQHSAHQS
jgi:MADS-box transcription factor